MNYFSQEAEAIYMRRSVLNLPALVPVLLIFSFLLMLELTLLGK